MSHTPVLHQALPSSSTPQSNRRDSVTSELAAKPAIADMLRINNLLNPVASDAPDASRAATPADIASHTPTPTSATTPTPCPDTPLTPASTRQQKNGKDNGVVPKGLPQNPVNYRPYECNSNTHYYDSDFRNEMAAQHRAFRICTAGSGGHGLIGDFPKHVPYASEKKGFFTKTGRDSFEVFQYKFFLPGDTNNNGYTVMWDYQIGLMRMTPFFKACGFQKTIPAKALKLNTGLIELCHSITGGALTAQGYWVPFACARAICLTFCYDIRWALTPIFGPEFVTQCLRPGHPNYKMFRIDSSIIQNAAQEAESWRIYASRSATPASRYSPAMYGAGDNPRPLPPTSAPFSAPVTQELRPKRRAPEFKVGSPFTHDAQQGYHRSAYHHPAGSDDEPVSPKSSPVNRTFPPTTSAWTSINRSSPGDHDRSSPPSSPNNTPVGAASIYNHHRGVTSSPGFRNAEGQRSTSPTHIPSQKKLDAARGVASSRRRKRRCRSPPRETRSRSLESERGDGGNDNDGDEVFDSDNVVVSNSSSSEADSPKHLHSEMSLDSDSDNVVTSPPPPPPSKSSQFKSLKRTRSLRIEDEDEDESKGSESGDDLDGFEAENGRQSSKAKTKKKLKRCVWTAADEEAARILMRLNREDARMAYLKPC